MCMSFVFCTGAALIVRGADYYCRYLLSLHARSGAEVSCVDSMNFRGEKMPRNSPGLFCTVMHKQ